MRITDARLAAYALPLAAAWQSSSARLTTRHGWLLQLRTADGQTGHGECAPLPSHGSEDPAQAGRALAQHVPSLIGQAVSAALRTLDTPAWFATPAARCAVETALIDLLAAHAGQPLADWLSGQRCAGAVAVNLMAGAAIAVTDAQLDRAVAEGFSVIKLKLGVADPAAEIAALRRIAARLPAGPRLRLDANRAWTGEVAAAFLAALAGAPFRGTDRIESIEEPLADPSPEALHALRPQLPPGCILALDESWPAMPRAALFANPPAQRLIVKLAPLGGVLPALALARRAADAGIDCVVTTGIDSACATLAAAHLAAAIAPTPPIARATPLMPAHGLATTSWLAEDTGTAPRLRAGKLQLPDHAGLGFFPRQGLFD